MTPGEILSYCPHLRKQDGRLVASSSWLFRILTLGLLLRQVIVDPKKKVVQVRRRAFWLFVSTRKILFRFVHSVTYGYEGEREAKWSNDYEVSGTFAVGLKLVDAERVHLLQFPGEGVFRLVGPLPDWMDWPEYRIRVSEIQETLSRVYVELVAKMIGVTIEA